MEKELKVGTEEEFNERHKNDEIVTDEALRGNIQGAVDDIVDIFDRRKLDAELTEAVLTILLIGCKKVGRPKAGDCRIAEAGSIEEAMKGPVH